MRLFEAEEGNSVDFSTASSTRDATEVTLRLYEVCLSVHPTSVDRNGVDQRMESHLCFKITACMMPIV